jgi:hypothetical protein
MKTKKAMEIIDKGWLKKPKGFRVHFQKIVDSDPITDYVPDMEDKPLTSDVVAWRLAWKLSEATKPENLETKDGDIVNIYVVDDDGEPVIFYGTGRAEIYRPYSRVSS